MKNLSESSVRKTVVGILCVSMLMSNLCVPMYNDTISSSITAGAVTIDTTDAPVIDISQLTPENTSIDVKISNVKKIDWSVESETNRICRTITIKEDGTYVLTGSNLISYENDYDDTLVDTQIVVPEGVNANLVLDGLNINNNDKEEVGVSGRIRLNVETITPFLIQGTANIYVEDTSYVQSNYTSLFEVNGTLNIKDMNQDASLNMELLSCKSGIEIISTTDTSPQTNMFSGNGIINIENGTFSGVLNENSVGGTYLETILPVTTSNKIVFDIKNMNISGGVFVSEIGFGNSKNYPTPNIDDVYLNNLKISGGVFQSGVTINGDNENVELSGGDYSNISIYNYSYNLQDDTVGQYYDDVTTNHTLNSIINSNYAYYYKSDDSMIISDELLNLKNTPSSEWYKENIEKVTVDDIYIDNKLKVLPKTSNAEYNSNDIITLSTSSTDQAFLDKYKNNGDIKYQWYKVERNEDTQDIVQTPIEDATQETYDVPNDRTGTFEYLCILTYNDGSKDVQVSSNIATVTVDKVSNSITLLDSYKKEYACNETITNPTDEQVTLTDTTAEVSYVWLDKDKNQLSEIPTASGKYTLRIVSSETENSLESYIDVPIVLKSHDLSKISKVDAKANSCTEDGNIEYYICQDCKHIFLDKDATQSATLDDVLLAKTGHSYGEPTWTWSKDNTSATATFECANCKDIQVVDATITTEDNKIIATVVFNDVQYTDSVDIPVETTTSTEETTTVTTVTTPTDETTTTTTTVTTTETSTTTTTTTTTTDVEPNILLGDVNSDGNIKTNDLLILKKHLMGFIDKDDINIANADMNSDGNIKTDDLLILKKFLLGFSID